MIISMLVAADEANGIGVNNQLLCHLPADLKYFKQITTGHCIAMGRKTFDSIGKPLPNRTNIVITRNKELIIEGCVIVHSVEEAITFAKTKNELELVIIGGGVILEEALPLTHKVYLTRIHHTFKADTFFLTLDETAFKQVKNEYHEADEKNACPFSFQVYERI
ncbi:MAG: dihydrofolate reductase [Bacteroidota bacterium]